MPTAPDHAASADGARIRIADGSLTKDEVIALARLHDVAVWEGRATIAKYDADERGRAAQPYEVIESDPNLLLTAGVTNLWTLAAGAGGTAWNATNAYLAVGTGTTAPAAAQTTLVTEAARQVLDQAPTISTNSITMKATFGTSQANVAWNELAVATGSTASAGIHLNRLQGTYGTKANSASWTLTMVISLA